MKILHVDPAPETCSDVAPDVAPPRELVAPRCEKRLVTVLRQAARTYDPDEILVRATLRSFRAPEDALAGRIARAMADLAATGSNAAEVFERGAPSAAEVSAMAARRLSGVGPDDPVLSMHARRLIDRARRVATYLRRDAPGRAAFRREHPDLEEWLGVSGEDDPPHRPVNVPLSPHPAWRSTVIVEGMPLRVRYVLAGPTDGNAELIVLLHGHSSKLEECDRLVSALRSKAHPDGRPKYCVAVPDMPSCGYTSRVDHEDLAPPGAPDAPILEFLEGFVTAFVETVAAEHGLAPRAALVAGGSLGGNLTLRLAERRVPWAARFAAWSPASVWSSLQGDLIKGFALRHTRERMVAEELESSRRDYFREVFADPICGTGRTQPQMWYRDGWPARAAYINRVISDRREIYGAEFRRWHWRLAYEQLVFSHVLMVDGRSAWQHIAGPVLLLAGKADNFNWTHIHDRTGDLGRMLAGIGVEGTCLLLEDTGHSIHDERVELLARAIDEFIEAHPA